CSKSAAPSERDTLSLHDALPIFVAHKLRAAYRDDVGYKLAVAGSVLTHRDYRLADAGVSAQHGLDLAQLHAEPTHLDLVIHPPQELKVAVRQVADEVAGAVHPRARLA